MVKSLRVGGVILESTPFSKEPVMSDKEDLHVHLHADIPMDEAMGPSMKHLNTVDSRVRIWDKIAKD
jgi:hypothetical protein